MECISDSYGMKGGRGEAPTPGLPAPQLGPTQGGAAAAAQRVAHLPDLTHLPGPLTEDAVIKCLQAKFYANNFYVSFLTFFNCLNEFEPNEQEHGA